MLSFAAKQPPAAPSPATATATSRVCLILEGTYPYVSGGVSTWVHQVIEALPEFEFAIQYIGDKKRPDSSYQYPLPENVIHVAETYLFDPLPARELRPGSGSRQVKAAFMEQVAAFAHADGDGDRMDALDSCICVLADQPGSVTYADLIRNRAAWQLLVDAYARYSRDASFLRSYAAVRDLSRVLWKLLTDAATLPEADVYHTACTGYAGFLGAVAAHHRDTPFLLSEHGIYLKERIEDIRKSSWLDESSLPPAPFQGELGTFKDLWIDFFALLSRLAYREATGVTALFQGNAHVQADFGAAHDKITIIPNGVDTDAFRPLAERNLARSSAQSSPVVGFLGRVAPIKDVKTLLRAARMVLNRCPEARFLIAGPHDEEPAYVEECLALARQLNLGDAVTFPGSMDRFDFLAQVDVVVLTSVSEGLPFAVLEAAAAGLPSVSTDVGACREILETPIPGAPDFGPAGIVTPVACPANTAAALVRLLQQPRLRHDMGVAGRNRVEHSYRQSEVIDRYENLYRRLPQVKTAPFTSAALPGIAFQPPQST